MSVIELKNVITPIHELKQIGSPVLACFIESLLPVYLAMMDITKKWTGRRQDWSMIHAQMAVYFADRMPE